MNEADQLRAAMTAGDFTFAAALAAKQENEDPALMRRFRSAIAIAKGDSAEALALLGGDDDPQGMYFRSVALVNIRDFEGAWKACEAIATIDPSYPGLDDLKRFCAGGANALGKRVGLPLKDLMGDPRTPDFLAFKAASEEFRRGRMAAGNRILTRRLPQSDYLADAVGRTVPHWDGAPVDRLLISGVLGLGDTLQYVRFVRRVRPAARHVTLAVPAPLVRLLSDCGAGSVVTLDATAEALQRADASIGCHWMLPAVLGLTDYGETPYLRADATIEPSRALRVGLCWTSSPLGQPNRAASLNDFEPLRAVRGIEWHSLVPGAGSEWMQIHRPADFADTAGIIASLDVVVTVDTSVAHAAGALGKPVWLLLPAAADWRWGTDEFATPWYPTARLFRRRTGETWRGLLCRTRDVLDAKRQTMSLGRVMVADLEPRGNTGGDTGTTDAKKP